MKPPRIGIIGTLVYDEIIRLNQPPHYSWGGISYSVMTMAAIAPEIEIIPVVAMGYDLLDKIRQDFGQFPNLDLTHFTPLCEKTNRVTLEYFSPSERKEIQHSCSPPLALEHLRPLVNCDIVFMNFVSGTDLTIETLTEFRAHFNGILYTDIHSLSLGIRDDFSRVLRPITGVERLLAVTDFLQFNEAEANCLGIDFSDFDDLFRQLLQTGLKGAIVTLGDKGIRYGFKHNGEVNIGSLTAFQVEKAVDPTGCGDSFGASFCVGYQRTGDFVKAVEFANRVAGGMAQLTGLSDVKHLWEMIG